MCNSKTCAWLWNLCFSNILVLFYLIINKVLIFYPLLVGKVLNMCIFVTEKDLIFCNRAARDREVFRKNDAGKEKENKNNQ